MDGLGQTDSENYAWYKMNFEVSLSTRYRPLRKLNEHVFIDMISVVEKVKRAATKSQLRVMPLCVNKARKVLRLMIYVGIHFDMKRLTTQRGAFLDDMVLHQTGPVEAIFPKFNHMLSYHVEPRS